MAATNTVTTAGNKRLFIGGHHISTARNIEVDIESGGEHMVHMENVSSTNLKPVRSGTITFETPFDAEVDYNRLAGYVQGNSGSALSATITITVGFGVTAKDIDPTTIREGNVIDEGQNFGDENSFKWSFKGNYRTALPGQMRAR